MKLLYFAAAASCFITSMAMASTITLTNATNCVIINNNRYEEGSTVTLYSYNADFTVFGSITPSGPAPLFTDSDGDTGVLVGPNRSSLTFDYDIIGAHFVLKDIATDDGCSPSRPCFVTMPFNPCQSSLLSAHSKISNYRFKRIS